MDRAAFWHLNGLIEDDPIFISTGHRPQRPVHYQLAAFLCRVGAESAVKSASIIFPYFAYSEYVNGDFGFFQPAVLL